MPTASPAVIRAAGIALAIAVGVVFPSPRATAGCGDHVHIAGQPTGPAVPLRADQYGDDHPGPPCHGPGCSNLPTRTVPPLTAPVSESGGAKQPAARSSDDEDHTDILSRHPIPPVIGSPVHLPSPIFDPPRAA